MKLQNWSKIVLCLLCWSAPPHMHAQSKVSNSQIIWGYVKKGNDNRLAIRAFDLDQVKYYLSIDPNTLLSQCIVADKAAVASLKRSEAQMGDKDNTYQKLIQYTRQKPNMNALGLHWVNVNAGFPDVVWDVAHQSKAWRTDWIAKILTFVKPASPLRLAICVQGKTLAQHKTEIAWLQSQEKTGKIKLFWVNHGSGLWGKTKTGWDTDVLLQPDTDIVAEVFDTEKQMLALGLAPSVFYQVPGLVTDNQNAQEIIDYGLIPLGSDDALWAAQQKKLTQLAFVSELGRLIEGEMEFLEHVSKNPLYLKQHVWFVGSNE